MKPEIVQLLILTAVAGLAMPVGAWLAAIERLKPRWLENEFRHGVIAFGGGALLSAVALVLVPEGAKDQSIWFIVLCFGGGGLAFTLLDVALARSDAKASQLVAMLADFVPEALALGAAVASGGASAMLLAGLMALQNLPEGFNSSREVSNSTGWAPRTIFLAFLALAALGPVAGLLGYFWLADYPKAVAGVMLFAGGGILYIIFQDIAPQAKLKRRWAPALGSVLGFLIGVIGHQLTSNG